MLRRFRKLLVLGSVAFTLLYLTVTFTPLVPWLAERMMEPGNDAVGSTLIVLANEQQSDGILGLVSYWRSVYAVRVWRWGNGKFERMVISGGSGGAPVSMAAAMREFVVSQGVPADRIVVEEKSTSTRENALFVKDIVKDWPGNKVVVTGDIHSYRTRKVFEKAGLPVVVRPYPETLKFANNRLNRWPLFWGLATEVVKIGYYQLKGWI
jgi:uncharacterized SAM-binding protein YcdF (DUF218 family)